MITRVAFCATLMFVGLADAQVAQHEPSDRVRFKLIAGEHAAIIVPSFAPGAVPNDRNIVFWRWPDLLAHKVAVVDDEGRLPKDGRSWN
jgi:RES domain-containing protein